MDKIYKVYDIMIFDKEFLDFTVSCNNLYRIKMSYLL